MPIPGDPTSYGLPLPPVDDLGVAPEPFPPPHWLDQPVALDSTILTPEQIAPPTPGLDPEAADLPWPPPSWQLAPDGAPEPSVEPEPAPDPEPTLPRPTGAFSSPGFDEGAAAFGIASAPVPLAPSPEFALAPPPAPSTDDLPPLPPPTAEEEGTFIANQGPAYAAAQRARLESERSQAVAERRAQELDRDQQAAQENLRLFTEATNEGRRESMAIRKEAQRLANTPLDRDRWWHSRGTGQKIAAFVSAIAGGLLSAHRGGRNSGLELILAEMDKDLQMQEADLARQQQGLSTRQSLLSQELAKQGDLYRARETVRLANLQRLKGILASAAEGFDPRGTTAQNYAEAILGAEAMEAEALANQEAATFERKLKEAELELNRRKQLADEAEAQQRIRQGWAANARERERTALAAAEKGLIPDGRGGFMPDPNRVPDTEEVNRARKLDAEADKAEYEAEIKRIEASTDPLVIPDPTAPGERLVRSDKRPARFFTEEEAKKGRAALVASAEVTNIIDRLDLLIANNGGSFDALGSEANQKAKSLQSTLDLKLKELHKLGALTGSDAEMLVDTRGGVDSTSFIKDGRAGLGMLRDITVTGTNTMLHNSSTFDGRWVPPKLEGVKATERTLEQNLGIVTQGIAPDVRGNPEAVGAEMRRIKEVLGYTLRNQKPDAPALAAAAKAIDAQVRARQLTPEQGQELVAPMADAIIAAEERRIEEMDDDALLELQRQPGFLRRVRLMGRIEGGNASPADVYDFVTSSPLGAPPQAEPRRPPEGSPKSPQDGEALLDSVIQQIQEGR